jgi:biopolymer transport protein ExbD
MGAVDFGTSKSSGAAQQPAKPSRLLVRIDMTPMVDIAFLLLIFFMVTTVFRTPTAMELILPEEKQAVDTTLVDESSLLTFMVLGSNELALRIGAGPVRPLAWQSVKSLLAAKRDEFGDKVNIVLRLHPDAEYESMVTLIDQFNLARTTRFSLDHYTALDDSLMRLSGFKTSL